MVSKIIPPKSPSTKIHRSPSQSQRTHHRHRQRKSPLTTNTLLSSLHKSLSTYCRKFLKFFQNPNTPNRLFQFLFFHKNNNNNNNEVDIPVSSSADRSTSRHSSRSLLPPKLETHQRTIILDLDETLVHSMHNPPPDHRFDFVVHPIIDEQVMSYYVRKRPGLEQFLSKISSFDQFEIVVFTAGLREYAALVLDEIDKNGAISHRLFRDSCREVDGKLVKDLRELGRDLGRAVIVDDNPNAYALQPENAIPVRPFVEDLEDRELVKMMRFFDECLRFGDMRDAVKVFLDDEEHNIMKKLGL